jgi:hypothetical protein
VTPAPIWIALVAALVSRDGCGGDPPKSAAGSATSGSAAGNSVAGTPSLAPAAAPPTGSAAAPTTTSMTPEAQAKLDKLVGARPGTHKPIKPTPESPAPGATQPAAPLAKPKPAKPRNQFPNYGRAMSEREMFDLPDMDRNKESYDYGATVRQGQSPAPRYVAYRCVRQPTCEGWARMGNDWKIVGWWGTD